MQAGPVALQMWGTGQLRALFLAAGLAVMFAAQDMAQEMAHRPSGCLGWHGHDSCVNAPMSSVAPIATGQGDLSCTTEIEEGAAGHCECETGPTPMLPCMHDVFTCAERCLELKKSLSVIERGRSRMKSEDVLLAVSIGGPTFAAESVIGLRQRVQDLGAAFQHWHLLICVQGVGAGVEERLTDWAESDDKVAVSIHSGTGPGDQTGARRVCLDKIKDQKQVRPHASYAIVLDPLASSFDADGVAHSFGLLEGDDKQWQKMAPGGKVEYEMWLFKKRYSKWDVICANAIRPAHWGQFHDAESFRSFYYDQNTWAEHKHVVHDPLDEPQEVHSCWGGLAIYRRNAFGNCNLRMVEGSELVGLHECIKQRHKIIVFNPRQIVEYAE